jgi:glycerophosphoryl diester phosphodiesterase
MAHRGGAGLWPENTMYAFTRAAEMGVDVLEMDIHSTADGVLVVMHDPTVERTTDGAGRINALTLAELKRFDAGYHWSPDGGKSHPFRGRGITVPTLEEVFTSFNSMHLNIDIKQQQPSLAASFCRMVREHGMTNKVLVGSFHTEALEEFRRECPAVATSYNAAEVGAFLRISTAGLDKLHSPVAQALQVPEQANGRQVLSRNFVEAAHERNLQVHAWTINETADIKRMLDLGVDGIITDYPDRLMEALGREPRRER